MAKSKNKLIDIIVAGLAFVLALVGFVIPWAAENASSSFVGSSTSFYTLFTFPHDTGIPAALVVVFAVIAFVLIVASAALAILKALNIFALKNSLISVCVAAVTILFALLALIFAIVYVASAGSVNGGAVLSVSLGMAAGPFLFFIGGVAEGVLVFLRK